MGPNPGPVPGPRVGPNLGPAPIHLAQNVQRLRTKKEFVEYLHRAAGHPVKKTWLAAIKAGAYTTWPGLTYKLVSKHLSDTEETAMGHLHKRRQGIRSTKPTTPLAKNNTTNDL